MSNLPDDVTERDIDQHFGDFEDDSTPEYEWIATYCRICGEESKSRLCAECLNAGEK